MENLKKKIEKYALYLSKNENQIHTRKQIMEGATNRWTMWTKRFGFNKTLIESQKNCLILTCLKNFRWSDG